MKGFWIGSKNIKANQNGHRDSVGHELPKHTDERYIPAYARTDLSKHLLRYTGFRTDTQIVSKQSMNNKSQKRE